MINSLRFPCTSIALICLCVQTACTPVTTTTVREGENIESQLNYAAQSVAHSLRVLAATRERRTDEAINTEILTTDQAGLGERATIDWAGPIVPLLEQIAGQSRYDLKIMGNTPTIPIVISVTANNARLADILKDAGLQAGSRANLVVYPANRVIELRYTSMNS